MKTLLILRRASALVIALLAVALQGCTKYDPRAGDDGLKAGLNYMQPMKWRVTYYYRVQEIKPSHRISAKRDSKMFPGIPAVGPGTYEVWMAGPLKCDEVRGVKMTSTSPDPTKIGKGGDTDSEFVYYNFAPDGYLPREISASVTWECVSFEKYAYWKGLAPEAYDKSSDLYKQYTKFEDPINTHPELKKVALSCIPKNDPENYVQTALNCYNYVVQNFHFDDEKLFDMKYGGLQGCTSSFRSWENKYGDCDQLTNVLVSMLREAGIPARPVSGIAHGRLLSMNSHSWVEYYLPGAGWVPCDPTNGAKSGVIDPQMSILGYKRQLPFSDYYFGKHDPYRIPLFKDWNYKLRPSPKTPNCSDKQVFMNGQTNRFSGVRQQIFGWEGVPGISGSG